MTRAGLERALAPIQADLRAVTRRMLAALRDPVARRVVYLIAAGGKRLRPALVLLTGATGPSPDRAALIDTAAAVELIHTATLIHDDIIDQSRLRRAQPTFHARWGTERALLTGDYLYATAFTMLAQVTHPAITRIMAGVCQRLCRGELREVEARYRLDVTQAEYLAIIRDKTASLIGGCCHSGAVLGGCDAVTVRRLTAFGLNFGLAFQIIDDCLDLIGNQRELGKSVLADLDKGALSLPIIYLARTLTPRARARLFAPLKTRATDPVFLARVARAALEAGAIARAQARARRFIAQGRAALDGASLNGDTDTYRILADYALARRS